MKSRSARLQVAMASLLICGSSHAAWQRVDPGSVFAVSDNTQQVRSLADGAVQDVRGQLHLINGPKGTRAWFYLDVDNGGIAPIGCDGQGCRIVVSFDSRQDSLDACFDEGPFGGPYTAIKFDAAARLVAGLGQRTSVRIAVPVIVAADNEIGQEERQLEFAFTLDAPDFPVTRRSGVCEDDFWDSQGSSKG